MNLGPGWSDEVNHEHVYKLMKRVVTGRWDSRVFTIDEAGVRWSGRKKQKCLAIKDIVGVAPSTVHEPLLFKGCAFTIEIKRPNKDKPKTYVLAAMSQAQAAAVVARIEALRFPGRVSPPRDGGRKSPRRKHEVSPREEKLESPPKAEEKRHRAVVLVEVPVDADVNVEAMLAETVAQLSAMGCVARVARGRIIWELQIEATSSDALRRGEKRAAKEVESVCAEYRARRAKQTPALWSASSNESMMLDPPMTTAVFASRDMSTSGNLDRDVGKMLDEIYDSKP
jgi:hypothetical protein